MIVDHVIEFEGVTVPLGFYSDGCTMAPDKVLGIDITDCCIWHDYVRRVLVPSGKVSVGWADAAFKRFLRKKGVPAWIYSVYYNGVKFGRLFLYYDWVYEVRAWIAQARKWFYKFRR